MNDDQMDEMLTQGVRDYNQPGAVPREEMWKRIRESRGATRSKRSAWATGIPFWTTVGIAAALILTAGIIIGRRMDRTTPTASNPVAAVNPVVVKPALDSAKTRDSLINEIHEQTKKTDRRVRELASAAPAVASPDTVGVSANQNLTYRLVVLQHLAGSEAMITSFRFRARSGEMDAQMASWSKELLSTTRLLESSKAAADPVMKRLLEDLDLVISQIVQYTTRGTTDTEELDLIEQSINRRGLMNKLRSNNTRRALTAGT